MPGGLQKSKYVPVSVERHRACVALTNVPLLGRVGEEGRRGTSVGEVLHLCIYLLPHINPYFAPLLTVLSLLPLLTRLPLLPLLLFMLLKAKGSCGRRTDNSVFHQSGSRAVSNRGGEANAAVV
jgi:hypothetical protein